MSGSQRQRGATARAWQGPTDPVVGPFGRPALVSAVCRLPADRVEAIDGYDAYVIGSAVSAGHWLDPARDLVRRRARLLATVPVSLFSSGPIGDPPGRDADPVDAAPMVEATAARDHRVCAGRLDRA